MEQYQIDKLIQKSLFKECIICGSKDCQKSHSISKKQYLYPISENGHVYGSYRQNGIKHFDLIGVNDASVFYNFCNNCDEYFYEIDNKKFDVNSSKQKFLLFFRILSAQYHQAKEETVFINKLKQAGNSIDKNIIKSYIKFFKIYKPKINTLIKNLKNNDYDSIGCEVIKINHKINFVYFNIINCSYDLESNKIINNNELAFNIFYNGRKTYIVLLYEKQNYNNLQFYINQLKSLDTIRLEKYITGLIMAFPFNLYIKPSKYLGWSKKYDFECDKFFVTHNYINSVSYLYNDYLRKNELNLFEI